MKIDFSIKGILATIGYGCIGIYEWLNFQGFDAFVVSALAGLMSLDIVLAWIKHAIVKQIPNPSSKIAKYGVLKKIIILLLPLLLGLAYQIVTHDKAVSMKIINVALSALALAEVYSNIGHVYTIWTGELLSEFDAITFVIKKLGEKVKILLEKILGNEIK